MSNLFPTEKIEIIPEPGEQPVKFGRSWKFDFDSGEFLVTPTGHIAPANALEAFTEWCQKALLTPRYHYPIYGRGYGHEFGDLIGSSYPRPVAESEMKRIVTSTLMVDPRTGSVDNFVFSWEGDTLFFTCVVTTINSDQITVSAKVVNA